MEKEIEEDVGTVFVRVVNSGDWLKELALITEWLAINSGHEKCSLSSSSSWRCTLGSWVEKLMANSSRPTVFRVFSSTTTCISWVAHTFPSVQEPSVFRGLMETSGAFVVAPRSFLEITLILAPASINANSLKFFTKQKFELWGVRWVIVWIIVGGLLYVWREGRPHTFRQCSFPDWLVSHL